MGVREVSWHNYSRFFKVDVTIAHMPKIPLMHPHETNEQTRVGDVVGTCTLWNWKFVKITS
jgi:hypothetical protein